MWTRRGLIAGAGALGASDALGQGVPGLTPFFAGRRPLGTTFNPADKNAGVTLSNANLTMTSSGSNLAARSIMSKASGRWYYEATAGAGSSTTSVGVGNAAASLASFPGAPDGSGVSYTSSGSIFQNAAIAQSGLATWGAGDVLGVALDFAAETVSFYKNNALVTACSGLPTGPLFIMCSASSPEPLTLNLALVNPAPGGFSVWG